jgi:hypothetical protein
VAKKEEDADVKEYKTPTYGTAQGQAMRFRDPGTYFMRKTEKKKPIRKRGMKR